MSVRDIRNESRRFLEGQKILAGRNQETLARREVSLSMKSRRKFPKAERRSSLPAVFYLQHRFLRNTRVLIELLRVESSKR